MSYMFWGVINPVFSVSMLPREARQGIVTCYPNKPIRIIVPGAAGGPGDTLARVIGQKLAENWGQPVVFMNPSINAGLEIAAKAAADGHNLVMGGGSFLINSSIYRKLPFDPVRDFVPIALIASVCNVLVVHPSVPAKSLSELISLAKSSPGQLKYASSGYGGPPHLMAELFNKMAGVEIGHVPYRGHVAAGQALTHGHEVQMMFDAILTAIPHIKAGEFRGLAVTTAKRAACLPNTPTIAECGVTGYDIGPAMGVLAPAGTPKEIITRLSKEIAKIVQLPDIKAQLQSHGMEPMGSTPKEFAAHMKQASEKWANVVKDAGIEVLDVPK